MYKLTDKCLPLGLIAVVLVLGVLSFWYSYFIHDDVIKWKHFPRYWPFVRRIHRSPLNSPHKGQWRGTLLLSLIYAWINRWVNKGEAGELRRHRAHYDVIVMRTREFQINTTHTCTRTHGQVFRYSHECWHFTVHLRYKGENHHTCKFLFTVFELVTSCNCQPRQYVAIRKLKCHYTKIHSIIKEIYWKK